MSRTKSADTKPTLPSATDTENSGVMEFERILVMSGSDKGGVGKSEFTKAAVDWLAGRNDVAWIANDPDHKNKTLTRAFPERARPHKPLSPDYTPGGVNFIDVEHTADLDNCFKCLASNEVSICDGVGSESTAIFHQWIDESDLLPTSREWGVGIVFVLMQDDSSEPIDQALLAFDKFRDEEHVRWIIVFNEVQRPLAHFIQWPGSPSERRFQELQAAGRATSFLLPKVPGPSVDLLRKHSMSVGTMAEKGGKALDVLALGRFKKLLKLRNEAFEGIAEFLLPTSRLKK